MLTHCKLSHAGRQSIGSGAGEILITSIERNVVMHSYDLTLIKTGVPERQALHLNGAP